MRGSTLEGELEVGKRDHEVGKFKGLIGESVVYTYEHRRTGDTPRLVALLLGFFGEYG